MRKTLHQGFINANCNNGITDIVDKSASTASTFCKVFTWNIFSFLKLSIANANNGRISKQSYPSMASQSSSS